LCLEETQDNLQYGRGQTGGKVELSTRTEVIPVIGNRPSVFKHEGWTVYLSVHDQEYLRKVKELRSSMIEAHPDKHAIEGLTTKKAHQLYSRAKFALVQFKQRERLWYWQYKMMPPDWRGPLTPPRGWRETSAKRMLDPHFETNRWLARKKTTKMRPDVALRNRRTHEGT
jgi:hypothetical protein